MAKNIEWPRKKRELHNHHFDSTIWNDLAFRDDDIIIATYAKAGTTWMQQIVAQLLEIRERAGVPVRVVARSHFATLSYPQQVEIVDRLAAEVMPYV